MKLTEASVHYDDVFVTEEGGGGREGVINAIFLAYLLEVNNWSGKVILPYFCKFLMYWVASLVANPAV